MPRYLFVYDERDNSFPERYRVVRPDEEADVLCELEGLTGTVPEAAAIEFLEALFKRYPSDSPARADLVDAVDWKIVELSYAAGPKK